MPRQPDADSIAPYLLRALYAWAIDHRLTPQVLVDAGMDGVIVPADRVRDGNIVLSIHPHAVADLEMGDDNLRFSARFGGQAFAVCIPVGAVMAIYCRENGRGIAFREHGGEHKNENQSEPKQNLNGTKRAPHLRLVK